MTIHVLFHCTSDTCTVHCVYIVYFYRYDPPDYSDHYEGSRYSSGSYEPRISSDPRYMYMYNVHTCILYIHQSIHAQVKCVTFLSHCGC